MTRFAPRIQATFCAMSPTGTGRGNVAQEQDLLVAEPFRHFARAEVGVGDPHVFGLATRVASIKISVAKEPATLLIEQAAFRSILFRVGIFAVTGQAVVTKKAAPAGDREGNNDAIALAQIVYFRARLLDHAHEFMTEDHVFHLRKESIVDMQVRAADGGRCYPEKNVLRMLDLIDFDPARMMENKRFHRGLNEPLLQFGCESARG